jgi:hypothetical protein
MDKTDDLASQECDDIDEVELDLSDDEEEEELLEETGVEDGDDGDEEDSDDDVFPSGL